MDVEYTFQPLECQGEISKSSRQPGDDAGASRSVPGPACGFSPPGCSDGCPCGAGPAGMRAQPAT